MPCFDAQTAQENIDNRARIPELVAKVNTLTDMLCRICKFFDAINEVEGSNRMELSSDIKRWWERHKKDDAARKNK